FLQANLDASTSAEPTGPTVADEPGIAQRLIRIVAFRVQAGLATDPRQLTRELVQSLVDSHLVAAGAADALVEEVVGAVTPADTCRRRPSVLWPPNHRLVPVYVDVDVHDATSGRDGFTLTSVTSSEPDTGLGRDDRPGDIQDWYVGRPDTAGKLRAERAGDGP